LVKVRFCTPTICARFDIHVFGPTSPSPPNKYDNSLCAPCPCHGFRERLGIVCVSPFPTVLLNSRCLFGTYTSLSLSLFFFFFFFSLCLSRSRSLLCLYFSRTACVQPKTYTCIDRHHVDTGGGCEDGRVGGWRLGGPPPFPPTL